MLEYTEVTNKHINYLKEELTLFTPCPICGQTQWPIQWCNVSEDGAYVCYGDDIPCKPFMNKECEQCGSQIHFSHCITKDELIAWVTKNYDFIKDWEGLNR